MLQFMTCQDDKADDAAAKQKALDASQNQLRRSGEVHLADKPAQGIDLKP